MRTPINRLETTWERPTPPAVTPQTEKGSWSGRAKAWEDSLENLLANHPKIAIAAAAGFGLLLGWIVKRK
jgi:ElaB/YqjD/DUF883 family membrane-anchored ribosome-binding protein